MMIYSLGRCNDTIRYHSAYYTDVNTFIVMKIMTEGNFLKTELNIKSPKINRGTLIITLLNSFHY